MKGRRRDVEDVSPESSVKKKPTASVIHSMNRSYWERGLSRKSLPPDTEWELLPLFFLS